MSATLPTLSPETPQPDPNGSGFDLVEMLLQQQQSLTAVEKFSAIEDGHDTITKQGEVGDDDRGETYEPDQARYYRDLMPATAPSPGQQFAFQVDLDSCSGCKACVVACHTLNGLEEEESWRRVGTFTLGGNESRVQHVTTACHHCEDPGCLSGCPVRAYDKDPVTGIVRHLDDQCIGCKYCTMMCPYEVPRYSDRLGIVRKCDMCHQRLSTGEAPACVQSCPNEAISIRIVDVAETTFGDNERIAPGAPLSSITRPTTTYQSKTISLSGEQPAAIPQDAWVDEVAESHWPLAIMLVATQISVGMLLAERAAASFAWMGDISFPASVTRWNALIALVIAAIGLNLAPLHLGKPLRAWRVFLGLRTSWLSREAVILGKYVGALGIATALFWMPEFGDWVPSLVTDWVPNWAGTATLWAAITLGLVGLFSSAMIYIATERSLWRMPRTLIRFFGTALVAGGAWAAVALAVGPSPSFLTAMVLLGSIVLLTCKLDWENQIHLGRERTGDDEYDVRSRRLVRSHLWELRKLRITGGLAGSGLMFGGLLANTVLPGSWAALTILIVAAIAVTIGEAAERLLYFCSVVYDRMPGTLR